MPRVGSLLTAGHLFAKGARSDVARAQKLRPLRSCANLIQSGGGRDSSPHLECTKHVLISIEIPTVGQPDCFEFQLW
jgi:hypothetical protein